MQKRGQIEEKESKQLKKEIDDKIYKLHHSYPPVNMVAQPINWIYMTDLSSIFSNQEIKKSIQNLSKLREDLYQPNELINKAGSSTYNVFIILRGSVIETKYQNTSESHLRYTVG